MLCVLLTGHLFFHYVYFISVTSVISLDRGERDLDHPEQWSLVPEPVVQVTGRKVAGEEDYEEDQDATSPQRDGVSEGMESYTTHWKEKGCGSHGQWEWTPRGFIVVHHDLEKLAVSIRNMLELQCLATRLDLVPVEPLLTNTSIQHSSPAIARSPHTVKLSEIFDLQLWNSYSLSRCYSLLARWQDLESFVPHNHVLVLVDIIYTNEKRKECLFDGMTGDWLGQLGWFGRTRHVCLDLRLRGSMNITELKSALLGNSSVKSIVVLSKWRGIGSSSRSLHQFGLVGTKCEGVFSESYSEIGKELANPIMLVPVPKIWRDAEVYARRHVSHQKHRRYLAVLLRLERIITDNSRPTSTGIAELCFKNILVHINTLRQQTGLRDVFIATDVGQFGSHGYLLRKRQYIGSITAIKFMESLFRNVNSNTMTAYENSFRNISHTGGGTINPVYVSTIQKAIAAKAECLLVVGGGWFQAHTLHLYTRQRQHHGLCYTVMSTSCAIELDIHT